MRKTSLNNKAHKKAIKVLKKYMTKKELLNIQGTADLWEIFEEAMKRENGR